MPAVGANESESARRPGDLMEKKGTKGTKGTAQNFAGSRLVSVNDRGYPVGEDHHRAKLCNQDIELIHVLRAEGLSFAAIASKFDDVPGGISKSLVAMVCNSQRRGQYPTGVRRRAISVAAEAMFTAADPGEFPLLGVCT